jgi:glycosyltransferase involved in cell wall biosynthesis
MQNKFFLHVFPYSYRLSGGHSNSIIAFLRAQQLAGMQVAGISPMLQAGQTSDREIHDIECVEVACMGDEIKIRAVPGQTVFVFYQLGREVREWSRQILALGSEFMLSSGGMLNYRGPVHFIKKFVYLNLLAGNLVRSCSAFHFLTAREAARARFLLPLRSKRFFVIPNVVDIPDVAEEMSGLSSLGIPEQRAVLGFLGRLDVNNKGLDILVEAFAQVAGELNLHLLFIGPDWKSGESALRQLATDCGCDDRLTFAGPRYGDEKWALLKQCSLFAALSRWEAFGISIAEAAGAGIPVLASDRLNICGELEQSGAALVCPLNKRRVSDAIREIVTHHDHAQTLSRRGREWVAGALSTEAVSRRFMLELPRFFGKG